MALPRGDRLLRLSARLTHRVPAKRLSPGRRGRPPADSRSHLPCLRRQNRSSGAKSRGWFRLRSKLRRSIGAHSRYAALDTGPSTDERAGPVVDLRGALDGADHRRDWRLSPDCSRTRPKLPNSPAPCWQRRGCVLAQAKLWEGRTFDVGMRRVSLVLTGAAIGSLAYWLNRVLVVDIPTAESIKRPSPESARIP